MRELACAILVITSLLAIGCGADPSYATPEAAVTTYVQNGPLLKNAIDIPAWNFTWNGLSKNSQDWFNKNWEAICDRPAYRQACGDQTNPEKQKMVAFGGAIAQRGPGRGAPVDKIKVDGDTAEVTFQGWDGTLYLVKEDGAWKVSYLFGIEEIASTEW